MQYPKNIIYIIIHIQISESQSARKMEKLYAFKAFSEYNASTKKGTENIRKGNKDGDTTYHYILYVLATICYQIYASHRWVQSATGSYDCVHSLCKSWNHGTPNNIYLV